MDDVQMQIVNRHGSAEVRKMNWDETPALFLKFSGPSREGIKQDISQVESLIKPFSPSRFVFAKDKSEEESLWAARKQVLWSMTAIKPEGHVIWSTDVAVPISRLAEIIEISKREGEALGVFSSVVGHVGDGNFNQAMMYDPKSEKDHEGVKAAIQKMMARALEMEGTISGEHAIGMGKMVGQIFSLAYTC
jgi:D-lactate dehydrogenase (cytochrome)